MRQVVREEVEKVLHESNRNIDKAKNHANDLMTALTQAQIEDDGMIAREITDMKKKLHDIIDKLNQL